MAYVANERTGMLCVRVIITYYVNIYMARSLRVISVLLLHHVGVNYISINSRIVCVWSLVLILRVYEHLQLVAAVGCVEQ